MYTTGGCEHTNHDWSGHQCFLKNNLSEISKVHAKCASELLPVVGQSWRHRASLSLYFLYSCNA